MPGAVSSKVLFFRLYSISKLCNSNFRLCDVDGNEHLNYCTCYGAMTAAHGNPHIVEARKLIRE
ncbi:MAG: hypothetical protein QXJ64_07905 [Thermosphaera sp.]